MKPLHVPEDKRSQSRGSSEHPSSLPRLIHFSLLKMRIMIREQNLSYSHQKWYQSSYFGSVLTYQVKNPRA